MKVKRRDKEGRKRKQKEGRKQQGRGSNEKGRGRWGKV